MLHPLNVLCHNESFRSLCYSRYSLQQHSKKTQTNIQRLVDLSGEEFTITKVDSSILPELRKRLPPNPIESAYVHQCMLPYLCSTIIVTLYILPNKKEPTAELVTWCSMTQSGPIHFWLSGKARLYVGSHTNNLLNVTNPLITMTK